MASWIESHRLRCGPLTDAASIFSASLGVERDPPSGARGLLALARAIERHLAEPPRDEEDERLFVELAGGYLGVLLCDALNQGEHAKRDGDHGIRFGERFFNPFTAIEHVLHADDIRGALATQVALAEANARGHAAAKHEVDWAAARRRILPRLVGPQFMERIQASTSSQPLCTHALVGKVQVCFVLRGQGHARYVRSDEADHWTQTPAQLLRAALVNLAQSSANARLLRFEGQAGPVIVARTGDGLDSSRLLLPSLHDLIAVELGSPFAVAIPHRDALFACSLHSSAALRSLRECAASETARAPLAITSELFVCAAGSRLSLFAG